jgi:hypothetical protein
MEPNMEAMLEDREGCIVHAGSIRSNAGWDKLSWRMVCKSMQKLRQTLGKLFPLVEGWSETALSTSQDKEFSRINK